MARYIFPAGSVTSTGTRQRLVPYLSTTDETPETEIAYVRGATETGKGRQSIVTDESGAYTAFVGPEGASTLHLERPNGTRVAVTSSTATTDTTPAGASASALAADPAFTGTYAAAQVPEMDTAPGADNTAAILAARARAIARGVPLWIPRHPAGSAWKMLDVLPLWSGARILSPGGILDIQTDHSATGRGVYGTAVDDVRIEGLTLAQSNATARNGVYGMFSFLASGGVGCTNVTLRGVRVTGGESAVVYSERMTDFELVGVVGSGVWADGIHLARGTLRGTVSGARIRSVGDDAIALVSITSESGGAVTYPQMSDITITGCTVQDLPTLGSGLAIVGAKGVAVSGLTVRAAHANGVSIIDGAGIGAPAPADVTLTGVAVTGTTNGHGFLIGDATDVTLSGCSAKGCSDSGVALIGATRAYVTGSKFRGNTGYGVYETGGSGNALTACDIGGNTAGASQVATAVLTSCKTT